MEDNEKRPTRYPEIIATQFGFNAVIVRCGNCPRYSVITPEQIEFDDLPDTVETHEWEWVDIDATVYYVGSDITTLQVFLEEHSHE